MYVDVTVNTPSSRNATGTNSNNFSKQWTEHFSNLLQEHRQEYQYQKEIQEEDDITPKITDEDTRIALTTAKNNKAQGPGNIRMELLKYAGLATMVYVIPTDKLQTPKSKRKNVETKEQNIYNTMKYFIIICQILGLLPQEHITTNMSKQHFKWKSWKVFYTLVLIVLSAGGVLFCFLAWLMIGYDFRATSIMVFYIGSLITLLLYLRLAKSWSQLISLWCKMDNIMNENYGYPENLDRRLWISSLIFMSLGIAEHILSVLNRYEKEVLAWGKDYNYKHYFNATFPQLFDLIPFNGFTLFYCSILSLHSNWIWQFSDIFIMLLCTALALRFQQITKKLSSNYKKVTDTTFWIEIREDYDRLSILCKELDDHISYIVLLSFSLNIFFLLIQLYHSLETVYGVVEKVYLVYAFIYLIIKVVSVSLYAAWINDESLEPAYILNSVPSVSYNIEIRRLLVQISFDNIALTGCRMFKVTRGIVLSIAGAIVTYELVLIQFNQATEI